MDSKTSLKFLNGKLLHHPIPEDATEKMRENLKTAKKIIRFVHNAFPFSSNHLLRSKVINACLQSPEIGSSSLLDRKNISVIPRKDIPAIDRIVTNTLSLKRRINRIPMPLADNVREFASIKIGNCCEMSEAGLLFSHARNEPRDCAEMFVNGFNEVQKWIPVEMFHFRKREGDHVFLVVDRDQDFSPETHDFWGDDAVVCDVWTGAHYPASMIEEHLLDYVTNLTVHQIPYAVVRKFNPSKQTLEIFKSYTTIQ
jgi:hypothetical protein